MKRSDSPPSAAELDALIDVAERNVVETDRRVRAAATTLETAWRGRAGTAVRWSVIALGSGLTVLVLYRALTARRRSAAAHVSAWRTAAAQAPGWRAGKPPAGAGAAARSALASAATFAQGFGKPARGPVGWLASLLLPFAVRAVRASLRDARRRRPMSAQGARPVRPAG